MRNHFRTDTFPTLNELVESFKDSKHPKMVSQFLNMYYNTLQNISKVYGFNLVRLQFSELLVIVHRPNESSIIIEIRNLLD